MPPAAVVAAPRRAAGRRIELTTSPGEGSTLSLASKDTGPATLPRHPVSNAGHSVFYADVNRNGRAGRDTRGSDAPRHE